MAHSVIIFTTITANVNTYVHLPNGESAFVNHIVESTCLAP